jgi:hypothetical protein
MCCRQLPHHINIIYPCEVAKNYTTSHRHHFPDDVINSPITSPPITYVLPPITTSHRHHFLDDVVKNPITSFPDDVVKNPITSPPIAQVLPPITTSHQHHLPRCCRQLPHHTDIISQMM